MLDQASSEFVNTVVTVLRYAVYAWLAAMALALALWLITVALRALGWAREGIGEFFWWVPCLFRSEEDKAKKRLRDLGY